MASIEELRLDADEVKRLMETATRQRVKDCLTIELKKIETKISQLTASAQTSGAEDKPIKTTVTQTQRILPIKTYAWDQSTKFMKIYVTVQGVQDTPKEQITCQFGEKEYKIHQKNKLPVSLEKSLCDCTGSTRYTKRTNYMSVWRKTYVTLQGVQDTPKEQITCQFGEKSFNLQCQGVKGKNYECVVNNLLEEIIPKDSYHKVKKDSVLVMLKKKTESTWAYVTQQEKKLKDKSQDKDNFSDSKDPNESLMNMMKKMYDEGDDEMKRSIAKAWSESNDKKKMGGDIF